MLGVIERINRETGTSTAIITHNATIGRLGDAVLRMRSGEIVERTHNATRASLDDIDW